MERHHELQLSDRIELGQGVRRAREGAAESGPGSAQAGGAAGGDRRHERCCQRPEQRRARAGGPGGPGAGAGAYYIRRGGRDIPVDTAPVTRGEIIDTVGATGTLQAVTTVQVGSQVSGNISYLGADFNSIVHKGQVIAKLDPSLLDAQVQAARASLMQAQANFTKAQS